MVKFSLTYFLLLCAMTMVSTTIQAGDDTPIPITLDNAHQVAFLGHLGRGSLEEIRWTADGKWLLVDTSRGIERYDYSDMSNPPSYVNVPDDFDMLTTHPVENWIIGHDSLGNIIFWDIDTEQLIHTFILSSDNANEADDIDSLRFDETGLYMGIVRRAIYYVSDVFIWNVADQNDPRLVYQGFGSYKTRIHFVGKTLLIASLSRMVFVDLDAPQVPLAETYNGGTNVAIYPDGTTMAVAKRTEIWVQDIQEIIQDGGSAWGGTPFDVYATDAAYSADGRYLALTSEHVPRLFLYDGETIEHIWTGTSSTSTADFSTQHFASHPIDNYLVLRDRNSLYTYRFDDQAPQLLMGDYNIWPQTVSRDGNFILSMDGLTRMSVWDAQTQSKLQSFNLGIGRLRYADFTHNNNLLMYEVGKISLWNPRIQQIIAERVIDSEGFTHYANLSKDGRWFAIHDMIFDADTLEWQTAFTNALHTQSIAYGDILGFDPKGQVAVYLFDRRQPYLIRLSDGHAFPIQIDGFGPSQPHFCAFNPISYNIKTYYIGDQFNELDIPDWLTNAMNFVARTSYTFSDDCTRRLSVGEIVQVRDTETNTVLVELPWIPESNYVDIVEIVNHLGIVRGTERTLFLDIRTGEIIDDYAVSLTPLTTSGDLQIFYFMNGTEIWGIPLSQTE